MMLARRELGEDAGDRRCVFFCFLSLCLGGGGRAAACWGGGQQCDQARVAEGGVFLDIMVSADTVLQVLCREGRPKLAQSH